MPFIYSAQTLRDLSPDSLTREVKRLWADAIVDSIQPKVIVAAREGKTSFTARVTSDPETPDPEMVTFLIVRTREIFPDTRVVYSDAIGLTIDWEVY